MKFTKNEFYAHADHLDSVSVVTDENGNAVQQVEYLPYGEVFVEERNSSFSSSYLFNAKELDNETGLYYYGARYLDPQSTSWLSVDPLWEKYPGVSPYSYCVGNPVRLVDSDGRRIEGYDDSDAETLVKLINEQLEKYKSVVNDITDYFYSNGKSIGCRYGKLSPILTSISKGLKEKKLNEQTANDLRDFLYGYTAGIASESTVFFTIACAESNSIDFNYAELYGGGVCENEYNPKTGTLTGNMECYVSNPPRANTGTLLEILTHEIVGHGVNTIYGVPGARDIEAIKYSNITRRISGLSERSMTDNPHGGDQNSIRKMSVNDRARIHNTTYWRKVTNGMKGR